MGRLEVGDYVNVRPDGRNWHLGSIVSIDDTRSVIHVAYEGGSGEFSENEVHLASLDWPELGDAVVQNPSPELTVFGRQPWAYQKLAAAEAGYDPRAHSDADNLYHLSGSHHISNGRWLGRHLGGIGDAPQEGPGSAAWEARWHATPELSEHVHGAMEGADSYRRSQGLVLPQHLSGGFNKIMADRQRHREIANHYGALPDHDPRARASFEAMRQDVHDQFHHLTHGLGVQVQSVDHDPYQDHHELAHDVAHNGRLQVMGTHVTGGHPFFSNEENDKFRAVHDFFGHVATRRGVDRHGEEAAWAHHASMFRPEARPALTTETRGQNAAMIHTGQFQHQKIALLPDRFHNDDAVRNVKTAGSDLGGSSSVETGDSIQRPSDLGAVHDVYVPDLDIEEGIRCPLCGIRPAEIEVNHAVVCKWCAHNRYGVPQENPGPPMWGQTTASLHEATWWGVSNPHEGAGQEWHEMDDPDVVRRQVGPEARFVHRQVPIHQIPHFSPKEWRDDGHGDDMDFLSDKYRRGEHVPPPVLDHAGGVLDGGHRISAAEEAGLTHLDVLQHDPNHRTAAVNHPDMTWHFDVDYADDKDAMKRGEIRSGTHRVVVRAPSHGQAAAMANEMVFARGAEPTKATLVHYEATKVANYTPGKEPWVDREINERGTEGKRTHITRKVFMHVPIGQVKYMPGVMGERPGEHRNRQGQDWEDFKSDIAQNGIRHGIHITVDPGERPKLSEGNHRRDAAVELGHTHIPAEVTYFGHSERHTDLEERARDYFTNVHPILHPDDPLPPKQAMAWTEDPRDAKRGLTAESMGVRSVKDAGFKGYVGRSDWEEIEEEGRGHKDPDEVDEDLWEKHRPEPNSAEQAHYQHHDEYPDSFHERHEEAYGNAIEERQAKREREDTPDHLDDHLHHWTVEHSTDPESFTRHASQPQQVDLRHGVYATQSHVAQFHIDRHLHGGEEEPSWHSQHGGQADTYLGEKHPLFVTHQGRLHAIEGHHRVAAALQRGDSHITGWHHDLDKHPIARDSMQPEEECRECHYHHEDVGGWLSRANHHESAYQDVQAKAKRLRAEGAVSLIQSPTPDEPYIYGRVIGDHGTYHSVIHRVGNGIYQWLCECRWGDFGPFGPDGWQRATTSPFLNRKCSHNLALLYEWNSHRMRREGAGTYRQYCPHHDRYFHSILEAERHEHDLHDDAPVCEPRNVHEARRDDPIEDIEDRSFEDPYPHVGKDGEPHSGVMIALVPPDHVAKDLAVEGGEDPYDMHVTLAYLGKDDEVDHDKLHWAMCDMARKLPALKGKISGFGDFEVEPEKNDGFSHVHLGLVDVPHIGEVYGHMLESLRTVGLEPSHDHGISPHMSIQYSHEPMEYDSMPKTKGEEFDIPHITLGYGGQWRHYPLSGSGLEKTAIAYRDELDPYRHLVHHMRKNVAKSGGMTVHPKTQRGQSVPRSGYQAGLPGHTMTPRPTHDEFMDEKNTDKMAGHVRDWLHSNHHVFDDPDVHVGVWHNQENNEIYLDGSKWYKSKNRAVRAGTRDNQISVWDNRNEREIPTGGTGEFDSGVPHEGRLLELWL